MSAAHRALSRVSLRWRLSLLSAGLTFAVLLLFAVFIGQLTADRIRGDFASDMRRALTRLQTDGLDITLQRGKYTIDRNVLSRYASSSGSELRVLYPDGQLIAATEGAPDFARLGLKPTADGEAGGYRVMTRKMFYGNQPLIVQYARALGPTDATIGRVRSFLLLGVLAGTLIALVLARGLLSRALAPITRLTRTARDVERTADPSRRVPVPDTGDEVAELAQTLDRMLQRLEAERAAREDTLARQRDFVADASHELRTPLTSVLANLELLDEVLEGEQQEAANSALRSSQRMRRLVSDLLILARADAHQQPQSRPVDLSQVAIEVAAEVEPVLGEHTLRLDTDAVLIDGVRDQLHRMVLNLIANAVEHTPPGSLIGLRVRSHDGLALLVVEDDGPGVPIELRERIFDRFVRATGDRGRTTGLGLAIVRAVARAHGGDVQLDESPGGGARFTVTLPQSASQREPLADTGPDPDEHGDVPPRGLRRYTSTTTGRTIGRRLSRS